MEFKKVRFILGFVALFFSVNLYSQAPAAYTSANILKGIQKLNTLGSVLYIAAHPDDENTRLITYLAQEKNYRTGYLSLTRGDGGQNLIGDEQGVDLGLIRTQELLAARRIDGAEQFFSSAYDFGFSKNPEETFEFWDKKKILEDMVFIIRKFQPDVIITRFPTTGEGGHGHHTASAILAVEAFDISGDPDAFPEQLKYVQPWKAKRLLWNTFNFGSNNTISEDQFKVEVGQYNPLLGKSYGEIAAESRSQHRSQGFGNARTRGGATEYFKVLAGSAPTKDLLDGVETSWSRLSSDGTFQSQIQAIAQAFQPENPALSVPALVALYNQVSKLEASNWKEIKLKEIQQVIGAASGLWLDAVTKQSHAVYGEKIPVTITMNNRLDVQAVAEQLTIGEKTIGFTEVLTMNKNFDNELNVQVEAVPHQTQPYWLASPMSAGYFEISNPELLMKPQNDAALSVLFQIAIEGTPFTFRIPVMYKFTDPVKGELYQPLQLLPAVQVKVSPDVLLFKKGTAVSRTVRIDVKANTAIPAGTLALHYSINGTSRQFAQINKALEKGATEVFTTTLSNTQLGQSEKAALKVFAVNKAGDVFNEDKVQINYDHIPEQHYLYKDSVKLVNIDVKTAGKKIGYFPGAGDKVVPALQEMGYDVTILSKEDITPAILKSFDAVIMGIRAYNVHGDFLAANYDILMEYIKVGGNLIVQYNTNSRVGPVGTKIGPYPFTISRSRVTNEKAPVNFLQKNHPVLHFPNVITPADFDGWVQERGIYFAEDLAPQYQPVFSMQDPGEPLHNGSLIVAKYGKGVFVYTGLVFFRELPAGVPGSYRLIANIIGLNQSK